MKFIVSSTALSSHLQAISRVINSKNALPILDCFLFELTRRTTYCRITSCFLIVKQRMGKHSENLK